ncbi:hypothetical protein ACR777_10635 [Sphingobacterium spiritivorum]|uniref:hypothetical protein n=1 Tax=Sphingobacterium spiritivorum TaxID=258 RepID=UPI003DA40E4C
MEFKGTKYLKILHSNKAGFGLGNNYSPDVYVTVWGNDSESKANALLISKAPEMLEMLNHILALAKCGNIVEAYKIEELIKSATQI